MKHHSLSVSFALLIGAVCLSGDSYMKCYNKCQADTQVLQDFANSVFSQAMTKAQGKYGQCTSTSTTCTVNATSLGCCTQTAYNNDCLPLNNGSCNNPTAYNNHLSACQTQYCGTGDCSIPFSSCGYGYGGTCCSNYGNDSNTAQAQLNVNTASCNQYDADCVAACPAAGSCSAGPDCSPANQDPPKDQGICCLSGTCNNCSAPSHCCQNGTSCALPCMGNTTGEQCENDTCEGGTGPGAWHCQNTDGGWMYQCGGQGGSPIVIDVTGQGFQLTDAAHGVNFDFFGDGKKVQIAWTARGSGNAWLVLPNEQGLVASGKNMFGNITPQPPSNDPNGFLALAVYDQPKNGGNGDGVIDARDAIFSKLRLWQDKNHDGISQPDELFTLPQLGVKSISLRYQETRWTDAYGNLFHYRAAIQDAASAQSPQWTYDVFLVIKKAQ